MMGKVLPVRRVQSVRHGLQLFKNRKTMWQMLRAVRKGEYRMSLITIVVCIVAIAYILFPFDIIPDYIPVVGWMDDGFVFYLLVKRLVFETQRYNRFKAMERKNS